MHCIMCASPQRVWSRGWPVLSLPGGAGAWQPEQLRSATKYGAATRFFQGSVHGSRAYPVVHAHVGTKHNRMFKHLLHSVLVCRPGRRHAHSLGIPDATVGVLP